METPGNRANDAACDARGRFWVGTMMNNIGPNGEDLAIHRRLPASCSGSMRMGRHGDGNQGRRFKRAVLVARWQDLLFLDSMAQAIYAYDFDVDDGRISNRRVLNDTKAHGYPDGATVDAEGCVWSARWGRLLRAADRPQGRIDRVVQIPARRVDQCVLRGAPRLDTL